MKSVSRRTASVAAAVASVAGASYLLAAPAQLPAQAETPASAPQSTLLAVGVAAPDFSLLDQDKKTHKLSDYRGRPVVLAFYPADMTQGCSIEARNLSQALPEFGKRGVQLFGVSVQGVESKKQFCDKENLKYSLLADDAKTASRAFGTLNERGVSNRVTFIIAPDGRVAAVDNKVDVSTHAKDVLAKIDALGLKAEASEIKAAPAKVAMDALVAPFALPDADGKTQTVGNWGANGNKATVLVFVSTRCPVSNAYNGRLMALSKSYAGKGVRVVGINANRGETPAAIKKHTADKGLSFAVLKDGDNAISNRFEAKVTPEAYVIDGKGVLRYHGRIDDSMDIAEVKKRDLQNAVEAVVTGKAVATKTATAFGCGIKRS